MPAGEDGGLPTATPTAAATSNSSSSTTLLWSLRRFEGLYCSVTAPLLRYSPCNPPLFDDSVESVENVSDSGDELRFSPDARSAELWQILHQNVPHLALVLGGSPPPTEVAVEQLELECPALFAAPVNEASSTANMRRHIAEQLTEQIASRGGVPAREAAHLLAATLEARGTNPPMALLLVAHNPAAQAIMVESALSALRREQLFQLLTLQKLGEALYPHSEAGVESSSKVALFPLATLVDAARAGLFDNLAAALRAKLFDATKHRAVDNAVAPVDGVDSTSLEAVADLLDRGWSRQLAHNAARLWLLLTQRFHQTAQGIMEIARLLEGSAFDAAALQSLPKGNSWLVTSKEFDATSAEDATRLEAAGAQGSEEWALVAELKSPQDSLGMTAILALTFLNAVDPSLVKWDYMDSGLPQKFDSPESIEFPTARISSFFTVPPNVAAAAANVKGRDDVAKLLQQHSNHWLGLLCGPLSDQIGAVFVESSFYGRLLLFGCKLCYPRNPEIYHLQQALSAQWSLFTAIRMQILDGISGGGSPTAAAALNTLASLLSRAFIPVAPKWANTLLVDVQDRGRRKKKRANTVAMSLPVVRWLTQEDQDSMLEPVLRCLERLCAKLPPACTIFAPLLLHLWEAFSWQELCQPEVPGAAQAEGASARTELTGALWRQLGADLCEVGSGSREADMLRIPSQSGLGIPQSLVGSQLASGFPVVDFHSTRTDATAVDAVGKQATLLADLRSVFPLLEATLRFAATLIARGPRSLAAQVTQRLATRPSAAAFFVPGAAPTLQSLFELLMNGQLKLRLLGEFAEARSARQLRLKRGVEALGESFIDEDEETAEEKFREQLDKKLGSLLSTIGAIFHVCAAAGSAKLEPPPTCRSLLFGSAAPPIDRAVLFNFAYAVLAASQPAALGVGTTGLRNNRMTLIVVKATVLEGFSQPFDTGLNHALKCYWNIAVLQPVLQADFMWLRQLLDAEPKEGIRYVAQDCIARLIVALANYATSILVRVGWKRRYSGAVGPSGRVDLRFLEAVGVHTRWMICVVLPFLHESCSCGLLSVAGFWRVVASVFVYLRLLLRGPLPTKTEDTTAWTWRALLTVDSLVLDAVVSLVRASWMELCTLCPTSDGPTILFQEQVCLVGLEILRLALQRDLLFIKTWETQRAEAASNGSDALPDFDFVAHLVPVCFSLMFDGGKLLPHLTVPSLLHPATARRKAGKDTRASGVASPVPNVLVLTDLMAAMAHPRIRKVAILLFFTVLRRQPENIMRLLERSPTELGIVRSTLAAVVRDEDLAMAETTTMIELLSAEPSSASLLELGGALGRSTPGVEYIHDGDSTALHGGDRVTILSDFPDGKDELSAVDVPSSAYANAAPAVAADVPYVDTSDTGVWSSCTSLPLSSRMLERSNVIEDAACWESDVHNWLKIRSNYSASVCATVEASLLLDCHLPNAWVLTNLGEQLSAGVTELCPVDRRTTRSLAVELLHALTMANINASQLVVGLEPEKPGGRCIPGMPLAFVVPPNSESDIRSCWEFEHLLLLDSLFLFIEDPVPPALMPVTNSASLAAVTDELLIATRCVDLLALLLADCKSADAILHLLYVRLPERLNAIPRCAMVAAEVESQPLPVKLAFAYLTAAWLRLVSLEVHLCNQFYRCSDPALLPWITEGTTQQRRLESLRYQAQQVTVASLAFLQSQAGTVAADVLLLQEQGVAGAGVGVSSVFVSLLALITRRQAELSSDTAEPSLTLTFGAVVDGSVITVNMISPAACAVGRVTLAEALRYNEQAAESLAVALLTVCGAQFVGASTALLLSAAGMGGALQSRKLSTSPFPLPATLGEHLERLTLLQLNAMSSSDLKDGAVSLFCAACAVDLSYVLIALEAGVDELGEAPRPTAGFRRSMVALLGGFIEFCIAGTSKDLLRQGIRRGCYGVLATLLGVLRRQSNRATEFAEQEQLVQRLLDDVLATESPISKAPRSFLNRKLEERKAEDFVGLMSLLPSLDGGPTSPPLLLLTLLLEHEGTEDVIIKIDSWISRGPLAEVTVSRQWAGGLRVAFALLAVLLQQPAALRRVLRPELPLQSLTVSVEASTSTPARSLLFYTPCLRDAASASLSMEMFGLKGPFTFDSSVSTPAPLVALLPAILLAFRSFVIVSNNSATKFIVVDSNGKQRVDAVGVAMQWWTARDRLLTSPFTAYTDGLVRTLAAVQPTRDPLAEKLAQMTLDTIGDEEEDETNNDHNHPNVKVALANSQVDLPYHMERGGGKGALTVTLQDPMLLVAATWTELLALQQKRADTQDLALPVVAATQEPLMAAALAISQVNFHFWISRVLSKPNLPHELAAMIGRPAELRMSVARAALLPEHLMRRFLLLSLHASELELQLCRLQLKADSRTELTVKRQLTIRAKDLFQITCCAAITFLLTTPLPTGAAFLHPAIGNLLRLGSSRAPDVLPAASHGLVIESVVTSLRLLSVALPLLAEFLIVLLDLNGVRVPPLTTDDEALSMALQSKASALHNTIASVHPSLISPSLVTMIRILGRVTGSLSDDSEYMVHYLSEGPVAEQEDQDPNLTRNLSRTARVVASHAVRLKSLLCCAG